MLIGENPSKINEIDVICSHTKKPCDNVVQVYRALADVRRSIYRAVLIGAAIGSGIAQGIVDVMRQFL